MKMRLEGGASLEKDFKFVPDYEWFESGGDPQDNREN